MNDKKNTEDKRVSIYFKSIIAIICLLILIIGISVFKLYKKLYTSNLKLEGKSSISLYIPSNSSYDDLISILKKNNLLKNQKTFEWAANKKNLKEHIYPGRYILKNKMNNKQLIDMFRTGKQAPVKVIFHHIRTKEQFAHKISNQIEADYASIFDLLNDTSFLSIYKLTLKTSLSIFIPNTYEFYWNTSAKSFYERMYKEYTKFWNEDRIKKAKSIGLSQVEIITLASIVDEEALKNSEMPRIAGVYMNRLRKRIHLQADPTIKFALNNFAIKRVLKKHLSIKSPYNTYKYYGLPPGPIAIPSIKAIDAVLNFEKHNYIYFCAKEDFSGYHNFAKTLSQHNINARKYQRALNKNKIYK